MRTPAAAPSAALVLLSATLIAAPAMAATQETPVTLVHAIPDVDVTLTVAGQPFVLVDDDGTEVSTFVFGDAFGFGLPAGSYPVEVFAAAGDKARLISENVVVGSAPASVVAVLDGQCNPDLQVFGEDVSKVPAGKARVTVRHVASDAPVVDVFAGTTEIVSDLAYGKAATVVVAAGTYDITVKTQDGTVVTDLSVTGAQLAAGDDVVVYAASDCDGGLYPVPVFTEVGQLPSATTPARIPTAVPAGQAETGWRGPQAAPVVVVLAIAAVLCLATGMATRGAVSRRQ